MKRLKNKVFITVFSILTISILSFIIVFNVQSYNREKNSIITTIDRMNNDRFRPIVINNELNEDIPFDKDIRFIDTTIYQIILDDNKNITNIINRSPNTIDNEYIENIAKKILKNIKEGLNVNNLYFEDYSYLYNNNQLIIVDNSNIKSKLCNELLFSLIIFIVAEIIVLIISKLITKWITKPSEEAFKKQKEFIEDASHELKTPLSVIISSSELLTEKPKETKWLNNIKTEANRMNDLIVDLLELSSLESTQPKVFEIGNLSKEVELSLLTFEGKIFENNLKLKYNIEDNLELKMDENNIRQLVEILLDNALKHSKENGTINLKLVKDNNDIILSVINEGEAIPKGEEEKIFERFYRVDKSRNRNESRYGLGLAIAKSIVEKHNGKIKASSNNGKTTFSVIFTKK